MEPIRISPYTLIYVWLAVGFVAGLVLLLIGWSKRKAKLGALGLLCSTVGGGVLGIFLILPVFILFMWLIFRSPTETPAVSADDSSTAEGSTSAIDET